MTYQSECIGFEANERESVASYWKQAITEFLVRMTMVIITILAIKLLYEKMRERCRKLSIDRNVNKIT